MTEVEMRQCCAESPQHADAKMIALRYSYQRKKVLKCWTMLYMISFKTILTQIWSLKYCNLCAWASSSSRPPSVENDHGKCSRWVHYMWSNDDYGWTGRCGSDNLCYSSHICRSMLRLGWEVDPSIRLFFTLPRSWNFPPPFWGVLEDAFPIPAVVSKSLPLGCI